MEIRLEQKNETINQKDKEINQLKQILKSNNIKVDYFHNKS